MSDSTVYEVNKDITVTEIMQLVDLNGSTVNFQSDVIVECNPDTPIRVALANQEQLDNGDLTWETTEGGKYARRISYQDGIHQNHFIALKKLETTPVEAHVTVRMRKIQPREPRQEPREPRQEPRQEPREPRQETREPRQEPRQEPREPRQETREPRQEPRQEPRPLRENTSQLNPSIHPTVRKELTEQLSTLPQHPRYANAEDSVIVPKKSNNPYYVTAYICLGLFLAIICYKMSKK